MAIPEIPTTPAQAGPLEARGGISDYFRGGQNFRAMVRRMDIVRGVASRNELGTLPLTTSPTVGGPVGYAIPGNDTSIRWWAPAVTGNQSMFAIRMIAIQGGKLQRNPPDGEPADECLLDCASELSTDTGKKFRRSAR